MKKICKLPDEFSLQLFKVVRKEMLTGCASHKMSNETLDTATESAVVTLMGSRNRKRTLCKN